MKLILMLLLATITQAQILTGLLTDGNYRGTDITDSLSNWVATDYYSYIGTIDSGVITKLDTPKIVLLGDSNTQINWLDYDEKWGYILQGYSQIETKNFGYDGSIAKDFAMTNLLNWKDTPYDYYIICFGLNDRDADAYGGSNTESELLDSFYVYSIALVDTILSLGGVPIFMANGKVDYPDHYSWDRNTQIQRFDSVKSVIATDSSYYYIDIYSRFESEFNSGNWDLRIRQDGTIDDSQDAENVGLGATWFTNIHYNAEGCDVVADEIRDYFVSNNILRGFGIETTLNTSSGKDHKIIFRAKDIDRVDQLVNDPNFNDASSWAGENGTSVIIAENGYLEYVNSTSSTLPYQSSVFGGIVGSTVIAEVSITEYSQGSLQIRFGNGLDGQLMSKAGNFREEKVVTGDANLYLRTKNGFTGKVSSIKIWEKTDSIHANTKPLYLYVDGSLAKTTSILDSNFTSQYAYSFTATADTVQLRFATDRTGQAIIDNVTLKR